MDQTEFARLRRWLGKTQESMSQLLGVSVRAIHSYEQGWRSVPVHVERQMLFLVARKLRGSNRKGKACWAVNRCARDAREQCPAWEFKLGDMCWFITGTHCQGAIQICWEEKMQLCRDCELMQPLMAVMAGTEDN